MNEQITGSKSAGILIKILGLFQLTIGFFSLLIAPLEILPSINSGPRNTDHYNCPDGQNKTGRDEGTISLQSFLNNESLQYLFTIGPTELWQVTRSLTTSVVTGASENRVNSMSCPMHNPIMMFNSVSVLFRTIA